MVVKTTRAPDYRGLLQHGEKLLAAGDLSGSRDCYLRLLAGDAEDAAAANLGMADLRAHVWKAALSWSRRARRLTPDNPDAAFIPALVHAFVGDGKKAVYWCRRVLDIDYDFFDAHLLLANIGMPGPDYFELLSRIHHYLRPVNYLEIGVMNGDSLKLVMDGTKAVGIDPDPQISFPLGKNTKVFTMTSDDFFASGLTEEEFGCEPVQLAFVDGMHVFEYALRDFINIEKRGCRGTVVLFHDCYPLDEITSLSERMTLFWTGDVWKIIVCLKKYRPDLKIDVIKTGPSGLGVVTGLDPSNRVLAENLDEIISEFEEFDFDYLLRYKDRKLNAVHYSWQTVQGILDDRLA